VTLRTPGPARPRRTATADYSRQLRRLLLEADTRSVALTKFTESAQASDLSEAPNCRGFGRVHHFHRVQGPLWPENPLPIDPAASALGLPQVDELPAQAFQSAGCNWRCWYCYVPFEDLTGRRGEMVSVAEMVRGYGGLADRPPMVDLTGGQPDLTPEWPVWFIEELERQKLESCYVWSDDNLSTDYLWKHLSSQQLAFLGEHPRYGRACCLKGYDAESFAFNTHASPEEFDYQFTLLERMQRETCIDFYVYATITAPSTDGLADHMAKFVDRLQRISESLPLRTVPLEILEWGPVSGRLDPSRRAALNNQYGVVSAWQEELARRFTGPELALKITAVPR
jgi:uncharacterized Fe-S cluster-containing radical SAM superfamily protein